MAIENEHIVSDMVEATEFQELSMRYNVRGVPRTMIGEDFSVEGAMPEAQMVQKVLSAYQDYYG
jgi:predicted DsbA family dithiol-disulfide isomerase